MSTKKISIILVVGVILAVILYASALIYFTWPISEMSINKSGIFGDSFGVLTSLFSGLAFSGMLIAILLQKEELSLQRKELVENRKEFHKSAQAQENNAKLMALSALLKEYKEQQAVNDKAIENNNPMLPMYKKIIDENQDLIKRKQIIIEEIEKLLEETGIAYN